VRQLDSVVTAMRGIAASRARQSRKLLPGIETYAETISHAIGQALAFAAAAPPHSLGSRPRGRAMILFCAEQGFAGAFSDRTLDAAGADLAGAHLLIVGTRGAAIAKERGLDPESSTAMASQINAVPDVANRLADALYAHIAGGKVARAEVVFPRIDADRNIQVRRSALFPLDLETFRRPQAAIAPLVTLEPELLIERLAAEYIYAKLCEAAMHAFAAENQARMESMSLASNNIGRMLDGLKQRENQVRQEDVTAEIVELAAGARAR
jgi:F-type H+-transporting ATPase subunit gamma